jgi:hypothetical protein
MFQCTECLKEFNTERALAGHRSSHYRFNPSYLGNRKKEKVIDLPQPKECNYCGKQFANGWQLGGHKSKCIMKLNVENIFTENLFNNINNKIQVNVVNTT